MSLYQESFLNENCQSIIQMKRRYINHIVPFQTTNKTCFTFHQHNPSTWAPNDKPIWEPKTQIHMCLHVHLICTPFIILNGNDEKSSDCVWKSSVMQFSGRGSYETQRDYSNQVSGTSREHTECCTQRGSLLAPPPPPPPPSIAPSPFHPCPLLVSTSRLEVLGICFSPFLLVASFLIQSVYFYSFSRLAYCAPCYSLSFISPLIRSSVCRSLSCNKHHGCRRK